MQSPAEVLLADVHGRVGVFGVPQGRPPGVPDGNSLPESDENLIVGYLRGSSLCASTIARERGRILYSLKQQIVARRRWQAHPPCAIPADLVRLTDRPMPPPPDWRSWEFWADGARVREGHKEVER